MDWSIRTRNYLSPNSSRSCRTQFHWSFIARQCINSEQLLRGHLSHRMRNLFTFHHIFRIDTRRIKFEQKKDGILEVCGSCEQRTQRSGQRLLGITTSCIHKQKVEETSRHVVLGRRKLAQQKDQTISYAIIYDTLPSHPDVSRKLSWWNLEIYTNNYVRHLGLLQRFLWKIIGWKIWSQKSLEAAKTPNKSNQNQKQNYQARETCEEWATIWFVYTGNRKRCVVCMRMRKLKKEETGEELCASVRFKNKRRRRKRRRRSKKDGETREWTIHRFVHTARG